MRSVTPIDTLLPRTRARILAAMLMHPQRWWYLSDLARHLGVPPSSLQRELAALSQAGILRRRADGNRVYYQPDPGCPFLPELRGLIVKTAGIVDVLRQLLDPFKRKIACAFVYGSIARGDEVAESDIDLLIIGQVTRFELAQSLRKAENQLGRAVGVTVYKPAEFAKRTVSDDHFVRAVLGKEKLFVIGTEHDLEGTRKTAKGRKRGHQQVGN